MNINRVSRRETSGLFFLVAGAAFLAVAASAASGDIVDDPALVSSLGDMALGPADAAVTIIEYASMSCPHCATFQRQVYPGLKARYIDTGKIRFVFREFPLDIKAAAGSMLARCVAKGEPRAYFEVIDALFKTQDEWVAGGSSDALRQFAKQAGLGAQGFQACLGNDAMLNAIKQTRKNAIARLNVNSTPSFFINGLRLGGDATLATFEEAIETRLKP